MKTVLILLRASLKISGPCMQKACPANNTCIMGRFQRSQCVSEFQGCGTPPLFRTGSPSYDGHYLGAVATYSCDVNYRSCDTTCLSTAQWDNVNAGCVQYKWENVTNPLSEPQVCKSTRRFSVRLTATSHQYNGMAVNFYQDPDILLHLAINHVGFKYDEHVTLLNSKIDGRWLHQVKLDLVKVYVNQSFFLRIDYDLGIYKVAMNGREPFFYPEKKSGVFPGRFAVGDNVLIHLLEIMI